MPDDRSYQHTLLTYQSTHPINLPNQHTLNNQHPLGIFSCQTIDPDGVAGSSLPLYLRRDLSIACNSQRYYLGVGWAVAMIVVYPIGLLSLYLLLLWQNKDAITHRCDMMTLRSTHPINTPFQPFLSIHSIDKLYRHTLLTPFLNPSLVYEPPV